jgi:hypothetical protein
VVHIRGVWHEGVQIEEPLVVVVDQVLVERRKVTQLGKLFLQVFYLLA